MGSQCPYKSPTKVIGLLAEITAKGGCLLLGVGPTPQGTIEDAVAERLHVIGDWLRVNGKAIYNPASLRFIMMAMFGLLR